jgi:mRNA interferase MazF
MNPGDVVLVNMPQFGGGPPKLRPALYLSRLRGSYQSILLCGITTQLQSPEANWDEPMYPGDADFPSSGLHHPSIIRLSYLYAAEPAELLGFIGTIDPARLDRLRQRLSDHLRP